MMFLWLDFSDLTEILSYAGIISNWATCSSQVYQTVADGLQGGPSAFERTVDILPSGMYEFGR